MQHISPRHQVQQQRGPLQQAQQQASSQHQTQKESVTLVNQKNEYAVNQLLPQQEHVDLNAVHSVTAMTGQEGGEENLNHQLQHTGETFCQNGAFLVAAEPGDVVLLFSFTSTDDAAAPDEIAKNPVEEKDEPDFSTVSGTAKSNLEESSIAHTLFLATVKMSGPADGLEEEILDELNAVMYAQQSTAGEYVRYEEEDILHHRLHQLTQNRELLQLNVKNPITGENAVQETGLHTRCLTGKDCQDPDLEQADYQEQHEDAQAAPVHEQAGEAGPSLGHHHHQDPSRHRQAGCSHLNLISVIVIKLEPNTIPVF